MKDVYERDYSADEILQEFKSVFKCTEAFVWTSEKLIVTLLSDEFDCSITMSVQVYFESQEYTVASFSAYKSKRVKEKSREIKSAQASEPVLALLLTNCATLVRKVHGPKLHTKCLFTSEYTFPDMFKLSPTGTGRTELPEEFMEPARTREGKTVNERLQGLLQPTTSPLEAVPFEESVDLFTLFTVKAVEW